jgi:hypothetical protein
MSPIGSNTYAKRPPYLRSQQYQRDQIRTRSTS